MNNNGLLLDTHVLIWLMLGRDLTIKNQLLIEEHAECGRLFLSCISLWEISMLSAKNRIHLDRPCQEWIDMALRDPIINVIDLTPKIAIESAYLPGEFHGDPADRIIVATARVSILTLLTRDEKILSYSDDKYINAIKC